MSIANCAIKPAISTKKIAVSVDGVVITRDVIAREIQHHPAATPVEGWKAAARALVVRQLLLAEAQRLKLAAQPTGDGQGRRETDGEALIRTLVEREVQTPTADATACRRYYDLNRHRFSSAVLYEVRHILFAARQDAASRKNAVEQARAVIAQLGNDPTRFSDLAAALSACPSGKTGGSLGQIGPGQTVAEFEQALGSMVVGAVHPEPVETRYGLHVVALDRRIVDRELPFEMVHQRIADWLNEKVQRAAIQQYISILAGRADIIGVELAGAGSPLVQ
jgi:peptidyl-prolyl cis-trans isomerase C